MEGFRWGYNFVLILFAVESLGYNGVYKASNSNKDARGHHHIHRVTEKRLTNEIIGRRGLINSDNRQSILCYPELNPEDNVVIIDINNRLYEGKNNEVCRTLVVRQNYFHEEVAIGPENWLQKAMKNLCSSKYEPGVLITIYDSITKREITGRNSIVCKYKDNGDEEEEIKIARNIPKFGYNRKFVIPDSQEHMFFLRRTLENMNNMKTSRKNKPSSYSFDEDVNNEDDDEYKDTLYF